MQTSQTNRTRIYNHVSLQTKRAIVEQDFLSLETDASTLSLDLAIDRTNVSRVLNDLHRENLLIKLQGRPTFYIARKDMEEVLADKYIPSIIAKKENVIQYFQAEKESTTEFINYQNDDLLGSQENESLHLQSEESLVFALYPNTERSIIIDGQIATGKNAFVNAILKTGQSFGKYNKKGIYLFLSPSIETTYDLDLLLDPIMQQANQLNTNLVCIHNVDTLPSKLYVYFFKKLEQLKNKKQHIAIQYLFTTFDALEEQQKKTLSLFIDSYIYLPPFDERTIKEKVEFILYFLQKEADAINATICISKNIISCLAMASYKGNIQELKNEIRSTIAKSYYRYSRGNESIIDVPFESLSDEVLNSIQNIGNRIPILENILSFIGETNHYFIPNIELRAFTNLKNSKLNSAQIIDNNASPLYDLSDVCINEMKNANKIPISSIKTMQLKELYDCIYPIIESIQFGIDDHYIYQFLLHLEKVFEQIQSQKYVSYYRIDIDTFSEVILSYEEKIYQALASTFHIELPEEERFYVKTLFHILENNNEESKVVMLLHCQNDEICEGYKAYINSLPYNPIYYTLSTPNLENMSSIHFVNQDIVNKIKQIDQGKGVVIVTDSRAMILLDDEIEKSSNVKIAMLSPVSLPLLEQISQALEKSTCQLSDIKLLQATPLLDEQNLALEQYKIFHDISLQKQSNKILRESLSFLDSEKAINALAPALDNIYDDLAINSADEFTIRFLHHSAFMLERIIKNEPLSYKHTNRVISESKNLYRIIERNLKPVSNQFGIAIPPSEIAMITEIFIQLQSDMTFQNDF